MKKYSFYGSETPSVYPIAEEFKGVKDQRGLYDLLWDIWCEKSCAPRLRGEWSEENRTLGQCSITSFLVQDIFGGKVFGVPLEGGGVHCYNVVVDGVRFDLTSEQFQGKPLVYEDRSEQFRAEHFSDKEKESRYEYLKSELLKKLANG